jgi:hypothetical protein
MVGVKITVLYYGQNNKTVWHQDISALVEKHSSAPLKKTVRHQESSVSGQIGTAFSFKQT